MYNYNDYQLSKARLKFDDQVQIVLLSRATGSVSSGNLSAFDVISSKARGIVGNDIVTIGNKESCPWQCCK